MTTTIETDHIALTRDTTMVDTSTCHDCTTDPTMKEALATTKDMHPAHHPTTTSVHVTL